MDNIIFFDSECGLCDKFIMFVYEKDKFDQLRFCSIHSEISKVYLKDNSILKNKNTIIFLKKDILFTKSLAISEIFKIIYGDKNVISSLITITPKVIGDFTYDIFAKYRNSLFGSLKTCSIEKKSKFLK